jgi:hypothetical protein
MTGNERSMNALILLDRAPMRVVEHRPVACVPSGDLLRCLPISGLQTRYAHRLEVYVPLTLAYRRKHPMFIPASKITPMCWETPQHDKKLISW